MSRLNPSGSAGTAAAQSTPRLRMWMLLAAAGALSLSGLMTATSAYAQPAPTPHQHITGHLYPVPGNHDTRRPAPRPRRAAWAVWRWYGRT